MASTDTESTIIQCISCPQSLRAPAGRGMLEITCPACHSSWLWKQYAAKHGSTPRKVVVAAPGSHLVSRRTGYRHHGIYVGGGRVVHYSGFAEGWTSGPVAEVPLAEFAAGNAFIVKTHQRPRFGGAEIVARARSRIGEASYRLTSNNCEHFCEWAINDDHSSAQVDGGTAAMGSGKAVLAGLVGRGVVAMSGGVAGLSGAGVMSGLASVGGVVGGGAVAGLAILGAIPGAAGASLVNSTVLADGENLPRPERDSRRVGRIASYSGAAAGTVGSIGAVSAMGVAGLSGAGITSGLAAIGGVVGGGMAAGVVVATAAPVLAATAVGYGMYKLVRRFKAS